MKKMVVKLEVHDDKAKKKAMKTVSGLSGVESVAIDMKEKKLTVTGNIDPVCVAVKLRKLCHTDLVTVGPAKEPEKKKEEPPKKDDPKKKDEPKPPPIPTDHYYISREEYPYYYYYVYPQENQNACVIL